MLVSYSNVSIIVAVWMSVFFVCFLQCHGYVFDLCLYHTQMFQSLLPCGCLCSLSVSCSVMGMSLIYACIILTCFNHCCRVDVCVLCLFLAVSWVCL